MSPITAAQVEASLRRFTDPDLQSDLLSAKVLKSLELEGNEVSLEIVLGYPMESVREEWQDRLRAHLTQAFPGLKTQFKLSWQIETHAGQANLKALPQFKNIIAVASGKGGVGKSTIAANLALALVQEGAKVGLLDADIYGPSQPTLLGLREKPIIRDKKITPIEKHGLQIMSIGLLVDEKAPVVWRGPMLGMALQQLLNDTLWSDLDYLIIDLPPGTGDVQLTLAQKIPVSGALMVTTPQEVALTDVRRACAMFEKLQVPLLGVAENFAFHRCAHCGQEDNLFGEGAADALAQAFNLKVLARIPLDKHICEDSDSGLPTVVKHPQSLYAKQYRELARRVTAQLSMQTKTYSHKFPKIKVE